jgi:DNA polymerase-3 subunit delta'
MPDSNPIDAALSGFRRALTSGRVAHAWLLVGPPRGIGREAAGTMVRTLFCLSSEPPCGVCAACRKVASGSHADVVWIEPESKSRQIRIEQIRDVILAQMSQTAYEGGWRAAVLVGAERMTEAAQNALLKTLEEPPPRTVLILLSDDSSQLLPTILSRCQRIRLTGPDLSLPESIRLRTLELLSAGIRGGAAERLGRVAGFRELLEQLKAKVQEQIEAEEEGLGESGPDVSGDVLEARVEAAVRGVRQQVIGLFMDWQRDVLALTLGAEPSVLVLPEFEVALREESRGVDPAAAFRRIEAVEDLSRRLARNLPTDLALEGFFLEKRRTEIHRSGRVE